ncbi:MAG: F0F1 ATP synthase subunit delta, partial [Luteimonas sp.]
MSQALTLARPYARAAFALAQGSGVAEPWSQALGLAARIAADPQVAALLGNPKLTHADAVTLLSSDGAGEHFGLGGGEQPAE